MIESNRNRKKVKHCKTEKRGNMVCNVCHDSKNDESSEQCSFSSDPPDKKYAYSKGKKYNSKDNSNEDHDEHKEITTRRPQTYYRYNHHPVPKTYYRKYPQYGAPRYKVYRPAPVPIMIIRPKTHYYPPRRPQPNPYPRRYAHVGQESRLHKDVVGFDYVRPKNLTTKRSKNDNRSGKNKKTVKNQQIAGRASDENVDQKFTDFITKDWSNCERSFENNLICYECQDKNGSHKECMFVSSSKPNGSHSGYSKVYKYASGTHENADDSNESDKSNDRILTPRRKGKNSETKKRKTGNSITKPIKEEQQQQTQLQKEPEIIYGKPYEFVDPYIEDLDDSNSEEKRILKRMTTDKINSRNKTKT